MNLDLEQGILNYALAQLAAQVPSINATPIDRDHLFAGTTPYVAPEREPHIVFSVSDDIEFVADGLHIARLTQLVRTPRLSGKENEEESFSAANFNRHRALIRATGELNEGGANGRLWYPSEANIAALSAAVEAESGYQIPGWIIEASPTLDQAGLWVHSRVVKMKVMLAE